MLPIFKSLHIISIVAWSASLFYTLRMFIYQAEALERNRKERSLLSAQYKRMAKNIWVPVGWTSAILVLIFGAGLMHPYFSNTWFQVKMILVLFLYIFHHWVHFTYKKMQKDTFKYSSVHIRQMINIFVVLLIAIVFIAVLKDHTNYLYLTIGVILILLILVMWTRYSTVKKIV